MTKTKDKKAPMVTRLTPYDLHIGEWVYGHHSDGGVSQANVSDIFYPVCIECIHDGEVDTADGETYGFEQLSPIPFNGDTVGLFDWSEVKDITIARNWMTEERFIRYNVGKRQPREISGLKTIHEVQQWYYDTYKKPLMLKRRKH